MPLHLPRPAAFSNPRLAESRAYDARLAYNQLCEKLNFDQLCGPQKRLRSGVDITDSFVRAPDGYAIPIRTYTNNITGSSKGVGYYVHGGGWRVGNLDSEDLSCRRLCLDTGLKIISVDYRLAPEHPYPTPVEDVWTVYQDFSSSTESSAPIIIIGSSSGGHLAVITLRKAIAAGRTARAPAGMLLRCPVTVHPEAVPEKMKDKYIDWKYDGDMNELLLPPEKMAVCYRDLAVPDHKRKSPYAYPLHGDFAAFPKTSVQCCRQDILMNDAVCFVDALVEAGVETELRIYEGQHTFWLKAPGTDAAEEVENDMINEVRRLLGEPNKLATSS